MQSRTEKQAEEERDHKQVRLLYVLIKKRMSSVPNTEAPLNLYIFIMFLIPACAVVCLQVVVAVVAVVAVGGVLPRSSHQAAAKSAQSSKPETRF